MLSQFILSKKTQLTEDVFFLEYAINGDFKQPIEGQFVTFILPNIWGRAYSLLDYKESTISLIIKRLENGRGGSKYICDQNMWESLKWIGPAGHFLLKETPKNKLFFGTGTWFVPLYYQILGSIKKNLWAKLHLVFWVRSQKDMFFEQELKNIRETYPDFSYSLFLSQENHSEYTHGRITNFPTQISIDWFEEFYICGSPWMVDDISEKLISLWVLKEQIFTEKY